MSATRAEASEPACEDEMVAVLRRAFTIALGPRLGAEALSDALLYLVEHRDRVLAMDNPGGYLFTVGRQRALAAYRRPPAPLFPSPVVAGIPDIEPGLVAALGGLSERQRLCVVLVHAFGYRNQEVADLIGISVGSVQTHGRRALTRLRKNLGVTK
ncbi:MAG: sigma-70 family RNA polymerase sigma factor [Microthrixaceae bacterium]|jgi:DNA-directed RNA polymerase specialized sigma24 family protein|nr:sigma-70 family RNA polymerase sigma factor [Microthrixaceae bacterium]